MTRWNKPKPSELGRKQNMKTKKRSTKTQSKPKLSARSNKPKPGKIIQEEYITMVAFRMKGTRRGIDECIGQFNGRDLEALSGPAKHKNGTKIDIVKNSACITKA